MCKIMQLSHTKGQLFVSNIDGTTWAHCWQGTLLCNGLISKLTPHSTCANSCNYHEQKANRERALQRATEPEDLLIYTAINHDQKYNFNDVTSVDKDVDKNVHGSSLLEYFNSTRHWDANQTSKYLPLASKLVDNLSTISPFQLNLK